MAADDLVRSAQRFSTGPRQFVAMTRSCLMLLAALAILCLAAMGCRAPEPDEVPPWVSSRFVRLRGNEAVAARHSELWVVPVRMGCLHCIEQVAALEQERTRRNDVRTAVLIIGGHAPRRGLALAFRADEVWWDRAGIWRRVWGRDDHGRVLVFDSAGRFVRLSPAGAEEGPLLAERDVEEGASESGGQGVPPDDQ